MSFKTPLFVKLFIFPCYGVEPVQQQRDIPDQNVPYAPPRDDQRVYGFAQDGALELNLYAVIRKIHDRL